MKTPIQYSALTITNMEALRDRAKTKPDGCYRFRGIAYRVRARSLTHVAAKGEVYIVSVAFLVSAGTCGARDTEAQAKLKEIQ